MSLATRQFVDALKANLVIELRAARPDWVWVAAVKRMIAAYGG